MRILDARKEDPAVADLDVPPLERERLPCDERPPDLQKVVHELVAAAVIEIDAIAGELDRIAASDDVDDKAAGRHAIESRRHAGRRAGTHEPWTNRDDELELLGETEKHRRDHPGFFGVAPGWNKYAPIAELIDRLRNLAKVIERGCSRADIDPKMSRIFMRGNVPVRTVHRISPKIGPIPAPQTGAGSAGLAAHEQPVFVALQRQMTISVVDQE